ncbi:HDC [Cordylochernes scorpioides]|uniref:Histidine decarboxylase n=1 Tax=Cordylochernes scorpioides TaxID=51811 RepID=A0ABY6KFR2_9ARAC|nr:HDC [Cordylochernes scorpioides]
MEENEGMPERDMRDCAGKEMVDYIADYLGRVDSLRVFPDVSPGYLRQLVPDAPPEESEPWETIMEDVDRVIMPGVTHWQSSHMHGYFPALTCPESMLGDMLANAISSLGFTWASSPACTELEMVIMDWLAKAIGLPADFLHSSGKGGGGVIQTTASESTLIALLAARTVTIRSHKGDLEDAEILGRLVAYCSDQESLIVRDVTSLLIVGISVILGLNIVVLLTLGIRTIISLPIVVFFNKHHSRNQSNRLLKHYYPPTHTEMNAGKHLQAHSSVEKAGLIGLVKMRFLESDEDFRLLPDQLRGTLEKDRELGLIPFFVSPSLSLCLSWSSLGYRKPTTQCTLIIKTSGSIIF